MNKSDNKYIIIATSIIIVAGVSLGIFLKYKDTSWVNKTDPSTLETSCDALTLGSTKAAVIEAMGKPVNVSEDGNILYYAEYTKETLEGGCKVELTNNLTTTITYDNNTLEEPRVTSSIPTPKPISEAPNPTKSSKDTPKKSTDSTPMMSVFHKKCSMVKVGATKQDVINTMGEAESESHGDTIPGTTQKGGFMIYSTGNGDASNSCEYILRNDKVTQVKF